MIWYILVGLAIVALIVFIVWLSKHHGTPVMPHAKDVALNVSANIEDRFTALEATFREELSGVPALVSAEVTRLQGELHVAVSRAEVAEQALAAERAAHEASLATVVNRIAEAIKASPEIPS